MSLRGQLNKNNYSNSNHLFFTPKLSLEGKNLFPHIAENYHLVPSKDQHQQPFLNVAKKPIMSIY